MKDSNNNDNIDMLLDKITQLKQQLAEKDKEIERLNDANRYIHDLHNNLYREYQKKADELYQNQTQLAISELEKVKKYNAQLVYSNGLVDRFIDQQINELKGEKDVED